MKISVDDQELFTLSDIQKQVIQNEIPSDIFDDDMKRRLKWVLFDEKYQKCMTRLRDEWTPKFISQGVKMLPTDNDAFAILVFSDLTYKDRLTRDLDAALID